MVIRPIALVSTNHRAPSGPAAIAPGSKMLGLVQVVRTPLVVIRPMALLSG